MGKELGELCVRRTHNSPLFPDFTAISRNRTGWRRKIRQPVRYPKEGETEQFLAFECAGHQPAQEVAAQENVHQQGRQGGY